jgi:hypothetical protein
VRGSAFITPGSSLLVAPPTFQVGPPHLSQGCFSGNIPVDTPRGGFTSVLGISQSSPVVAQG